MSLRTDLGERQRFWLAHPQRRARDDKPLKAYALENDLGTARQRWRRSADICAGCAHDTVQ